MAGYQLKITLSETNPAVWRRVMVPTGVSFARLHDIIQVVFEWDNEHLYSFELPQAKKLIVSAEAQQWSASEDDLLANEVLIDDFLRPQMMCRYVYDFGDEWGHEIVCERVAEDYGLPFAQLLAFAGDSLPEGSGGVSGYEELCRGAKAGDEEAREWLEASSPGEYLPQMINELLAELPGYWQRLDAMEDRWQQGLARSKEEMRNLHTMLADKNKEDLVEIAKTFQLKRYSTYKKAELIENLYQLMQQPEALQQVMMAASDVEIRLLLKAAEGGVEATDPHYHMLRKWGLCEIMVDYEVVVPREIAAKVDCLTEHEYQARHKRVSTIMSYCSAATYLYGVVTLAEIAELFTRLEHKPIDTAEIRSVCLQMKGRNERFKLNKKDDMLMDYSLEGHDAVLKKLLHNTAEHVKPTRQMVMQIGRDYMSNVEQTIMPILRFLMDKLDMPPEKATMLAMLVHHNIRISDSEESFWRENGDIILTLPYYEEFKAVLQKVMDDIRRVHLGGYTPKELKRQTRTEGASGDKIVSLAGARHKKKKKK